MTILIVIHNPDLAADIASCLARDGCRPIIAPSVQSREFLRDFAHAALLITDLAPSVLKLLSIDGQRLLSARLPVLVLASPGHCESFQAALAGVSGRAIALTPTADFLDQVRQAAGALARSSSVTVVGSDAAEPDRIGLNSCSEAPGGVAARTPPRDPPHYLRRILRRQDRLISDIAHDLRTPLSAIYEFARLIETGVTGAVNAQQRRYAGIIQRRCQEAVRMVEELLDAARLQSGRIHPHRQALRLADAIADVREALEPAIQHCGVQLTTEMADDLPLVFADRDMLGRIVANLVSNALKFSPPAGRVTVRGERQSVSMVRVSVIDSGSGISPSEMRRVFRRFEQGWNRVRGGVGLGLSIVRQLVKLQGGRITVESTPGRGSCFQFTLPIFLPVAIVRRHLAALARRADAHPTIWAFSCPDAGKYDAIHRLVSATLGAQELVLPAETGSKLLVITQSRTPGRLIERLQREISNHGVTVPSIRHLTSDELKHWFDGHDLLPPSEAGRDRAAPLAG